MVQYIAEHFPAVASTSAFLERLQSSWSLENLQEIVAAVKDEYTASRAGYVLEVYLALQRLQTAASSETVVEAEEVKILLDGLKVDTLKSFAAWFTLCARCFVCLLS